MRIQSINSIQSIMLNVRNNIPILSLTHDVSDVDYNVNYRNHVVVVDSHI